MKTNIIVNLQVEGFHRWPDAKVHAGDEAGFLVPRHRHIFHIEAKMEVNHDDRDVEFILLKRDMIQYFQNNYGTPAEFESMSCEMIAKDLIEAYNLEYCKVMEDGENGAEVWK